MGPEKLVISKVLILHETDPDFVPGIPYSPLNFPGIIQELRAKHTL